MAGRPGSVAVRPKAPGLRSRKKAQQRATIIAVAVKLFASSGYDKARMEDIASEAGVSTKTVYNYFGTKRDILIEFLMADRENNTTADCQAVMETPTGDLVEDLIRLMKADIGDIATAGGKALWLEIMAVVVRERADERFRRYRWMFTSYIERMLFYYKTQGKLAETVDTRLAAEMVHFMFAEGFIAFCASEDQTVDDALRFARSCLHQLLPSWQ